jgi:hypothetical protein
MYENISYSWIEVFLTINLCSFSLMNLQLKFLISYSEHFPFVCTLCRFTFMLTNILQVGPTILLEKYIIK